MISQINQLEKDRDVVAQVQAIKTLEMLPQISFTVVNTLYGILSDSKVCYFLSVIYFGRKGKLSMFQYLLGTKLLFVLFACYETILMALSFL